MTEGFDIGADVQRGEILSDTSPQKQFDKNTRQRRVPGSKFIIPEDEAPDYEPPEDFPSSARRYLKNLARTGTTSGAALMAGISVQKVAEFRQYLDDFDEEEDLAKDCVTDWIESKAFEEIEATGTMTATRMKEFMLRTRRRKTYGDKQEVQHSGTLQLTWLDVLKNVDSQSKVHDVVDR